jgi:hypothetical protein
MFGYVNINLVPIVMIDPKDKDMLQFRVDMMEKLILMSYNYNIMYGTDEVLE